MADFKKFVANSKALKAASKTQEQQAKARWDTMQQSLDNLRQPTPASGQSPIEILLNDDAYMQALEGVTVLSPGFNSAKNVKDYVDKTSRSIQKYIDQHEQANERY